MSYAYDLRGRYAAYDDDIDDMEMYERECLRQDWLIDRYGDAGLCDLDDDEEWLI